MNELISPKLIEVDTSFVDTLNKCRVDLTLSTAVKVRDSHLEGVVTVIDRCELVGAFINVGTSTGRTNCSRPNKSHEGGYNA